MAKKGALCPVMKAWRRTSLTEVQKKKKKKKKKTGLVTGYEQTHSFNLNAPVCWCALCAGVCC